MTRDTKNDSIINVPAIIWVSLVLLYVMAMEMLCRATALASVVVSLQDFFSPAFCDVGSALPSVIADQ